MGGKPEPSIPRLLLPDLQAAADGAVAAVGSSREAGSSGRGREEETHGERSCRPGWRSRAGGPRRLPLRSASQGCGHPRSGQRLVGARGRRGRAVGRCPAAAGGAAPPGTASLGSSLRGTLPGTRKRKRRRSREPASRRERAGVQPGGSRGGAVRSFLLCSGFLRSRPGWLRSGEVLAPGRLLSRRHRGSRLGPLYSGRLCSCRGSLAPLCFVLCHLKVFSK